MESRSTASLSSSPDAVSAAVVGASAAAKHFHLTLRAKGVVALLALIAYGASIALYMTHERGRLMHVVQQLEYVHARHEILTKVNTGLTHSIVSLQNLLNSGVIKPPTDDIVLDLNSFEPSLPALKASYPESGPFVALLQRNVDEMVKTRSVETVNALRDSEQQLAAQLEYFENEVERSGERLSLEYRSLNQDMSAFALVMNLLGLVVFGVGMTLFFSRLAADIKTLEARAMAIVRGYRGMPVEVTRHDELGGLMSAINCMQTELSRREQQEEVSRQRRFHQEKMAAVGSFAAAVAHEVGNPINSISGIAQITIEAVRSNRRMDDEMLCGNAELTLKQTERIGSILRHFADLSASRSSEPELLDVNELVQANCNFIRFDKRFRHISLVLDTDGDVPAIIAVADYLTQVIMNLLINAADAMEGLTDRDPTIRVSTRRLNDDLILSVSDNGHGMNNEVAAHVFEQSFSTKPPGKGRGIGLYLCKTLIEESGGRIEIESMPGAGTTARVHLPVRRAVNAAA